MDHVFDDLIGLQRTQPRWNWRPTVQSRRTGNFP